MDDIEASCVVKTGFYFESKFFVSFQVTKMSFDLNQIRSTVRLDGLVYLGL